MIRSSSGEEMGNNAASFDSVPSGSQDNASEKENKKLSALYKVAKTVSQSFDQHEVLNDTLNIILQIMDADGGGIYLMDEDKSHMTLEVHKGLSRKFSEGLKKIETGKGISGRAAKLRIPVTMDISSYPDPEYKPLLLEEGIRSLASAPLLYKEKMLGAINIFRRKLHDFNREELELFSSIASELGIAIENSRLFSELERHNEMLDTLYAIESVVSRSLDLEEIFNVALTKSLEVTGTEAGTLYSIDGNILRLEAFRGLSPEFREKALIRKMGEGIPGLAAQLKKPVTMDISMFPSPELLPFIEKEGLVSFIGAPLMSKGKVVGAISLGTSKKRIFSKDELDLIFSIGNAIGIAAENARLYKESMENLKKLQKAYEELKTLDNMKDELISNVSHELKTPLISIKGYGELLFDEKLGKLSHEQKKSLEAIIRNADRLTRLINSILFISKLQAGKVEYKFESLDIKEVIKTCADDFRRILDKKHIQLELDIPELPHVPGDRDRFIEVITNLMDNAVKFTQQGGKISIKARGEQEFLHITISDNGIGIPPEILPKLFTRFYQVDASTARKFGGTGLGLYITKNIIDVFKGKIWIESEVGKGTTVHVLLAK